jgi:aryl-alcohol dehydrogenase-like predicted oxidoreductase
VGAKHVHQALNASLKRLGTDYIDLYWMHIWDNVTPVHEIVQVLGDLVRAGKIRYYCFSDMPAWMAAKAAAIATERGVPGPIAMQVEYSLVARDVEREHVPAALDGGMGIVPWSPLEGGFLTGKYSRGEQPSAGRLSGANPLGDSKFTERNYDILDVLKQVAGELDATPAQTALAWVVRQRGVDTTLIGASSVKQLEANLAAAEVHLSAEQSDRLNAASPTTPGFSDSLASPDIRRMLFGGHDVTAWGER